MSRKVFVKSYGCQMNVYDSERMRDVLRPSGYEATERVEDADLILLNTCHIREKAAEKTYHELGRLRDLKAAKPDLKIGVAGCVAQAEGAEILSRMPLVDLVVGPQSYPRLPEMAEAIAKGARVVDTDFPAGDKFDALPPRLASAQSSAFVTVQEGCDRFCAFCVVPYTRGAEYSRDPERILSEVRRLVQGGTREVTLLGQNVNAYHGQGWSLARLIAALAEIDGLERIRYTTSHPVDMGDDLIAAHRDIAKVMPYLHLPVQSGSDRILKAMNRKHTAAYYRDVIAKIRDARPDILLSSDFIAAFPGESEEDHQATLRLIDDIGFGMAYSFKYSPRPGTPAAERAEIDSETADRRLHEIQALVTRHQVRVQEDMVGRDMDVLFEKPGREPGQMTGKSPYLHPVFADAPGLAPGAIARVRIVSARTNSLEGRLIA